MALFIWGGTVAAKSKKGGARKGAGRKPKAQEERRGKSVGIRFTILELLQVEDAAAGKPISTFLRKIVLRYLARRRKK